MNLWIITKNHAADSKKRNLKIDFRADWTHEYIPTAWDLILAKKFFYVRFLDIFYIQNLR